MKVKKLIEKLKQVGPNKDVYIPHYEQEYDHLLVNTVRSKRLQLDELSEDVIIIDFE